MNIENDCSGIIRTEILFEFDTRCPLVFCIGVFTDYCLGISFVKCFDNNQQFCQFLPDFLKCEIV